MALPQSIINRNVLARRLCHLSHMLNASNGTRGNYIEKCICCSHTEINTDTSRYLSIEHCHWHFRFINYWPSTRHWLEFMPSTCICLLAHIIRQFGSAIVGNLCHVARETFPKWPQHFLYTHFPIKFITPSSERQSNSLSLPLSAQPSVSCPV